MSISGVSVASPPNGDQQAQTVESTFAEKSPRAPAEPKFIEVIDSSGKMSAAQIKTIVDGWKREGQSVRNRGNEKGRVVDLSKPLVVKKSSAEAPRQIPPSGAHSASQLAISQIEKPPGIKQRIENLFKDNK